MTIGLTVNKTGTAWSSEINLKHERNLSAEKAMILRVERK